MPTYDLTCQDCGERFERFIPRLLRDEDRVCPQCGSTQVRTGVGGGMLRVGTKDSMSSSCGSGAFG